MNPESLLTIRYELAQSWGPDFRRIRAIVCHLTDGNWRSISDLVQMHATSHRSVTRLTKLLDPWLEMDERQVRIRPEAIDAVASVFGCSEDAINPILDSYDVAASESVAALTSMTKIIERFAHRAKHLDHVSATPLTCVKRALFLARNYELTEANILFLGDHDLTSVALAHLCPKLEMTVVDIDESVLDCISDLSYESGWRIRGIFADLRLELPRSLVERFDLIFTDPPYTAAGIQLFLQRGIEALKQAGYARMLLCYGFSENHPGLGVKVQSVFHKLHLALEAILPRFSRYSGAEAIGSQSALYIYRPTRKTRPAVARLGDASPRIYTHGRDAEESQPETLPLNLSKELQRFINDHANNDITYVGDGYPEKMTAESKVVSLCQYLRDMYHVQGKPPFTKEPHSDVVIVNLYRHYDAYLIRVLLASSAERLAIVVAKDALRSNGIADEGATLRTLLECKYQLVSITLGNGSQPAVIILKKVDFPESDATDYVLRYIIDHRHAKLGNAWREALISWLGRRNRKLTKNQARGIMSKSKLAETYAQSYLSELPTSALRELVGDVSLTISETETAEDLS